MPPVVTKSEKTCRPSASSAFEARARPRLMRYQPKRPLSAPAPTFTARPKPRSCGRLPSRRARAAETTMRTEASEMSPPSKAAAKNSILPWP